MATYYGYKNHISIDRKHKLIRHFEVTPASVSDNAVFEVLIAPSNSSADLWADSAYRSKLGLSTKAIAVISIQRVKQRGH